MEGIIRELGIPTASEGHHHNTHDRIQIDCPWCSRGAGRYRMGIKNYRTKSCHCWTCGFHSLLDTLVEAAVLPVKLVYPVLAQLTQELQKERKARAGNLVLPGKRGGLLPPHRRYLRMRGFDPDRIETLWKVEGIGTAPRLAWRLFIPVHLDGEVVSWTTRAITDGTEVPYLSAKPEEERIEHKSILYGEDYCRHTIVIEEGPLDVWAVGPGAVATCGTSYTRSQLLRMSKYPVRVVLFDNEPEAQRRAEKLCQELEVFDGVTHNAVFETGKDASRASKKEINQFRRRFLE